MKTPPKPPMQNFQIYVRPSRHLRIFVVMSHHLATKRLGWPTMTTVWFGTN
jgi:hypothetical protein